MKLILAATLTLITASAPANEVEMMLVPKASAEMIVQDNLRLQMENEQLLEMAKEMLKHIQFLQAAKNCV